MGPCRDTSNSSAFSRVEQTLWILSRRRFSFEVRAYLHFRKPREDVHRGCQIADAESFQHVALHREETLQRAFDLLLMPTSKRLVRQPLWAQRARKTSAIIHVFSSHRLLQGISERRSTRGWSQYHEGRQ